MDLYRYLSEGGMEDPKFYILKKPIPNIPEIEWDSTHASYYSKFMDWLTSDIPVEELFQGEILATSSTNDNKYILIDLLLKKTRAAIPLIQHYDVPNEHTEKIGNLEVSALLTIPEPKLRHFYFTTEYASILQYSNLVPGVRVKIRTEECPSISGEIIALEYVDFQLCFVLEHDSSGLLGSKSIRFGVTDFISLIMAGRTSLTKDAIQQEQQKMYNQASKSNHGHNSSNSHKVPHSAPVSGTSKPAFNQSSPQATSNQHMGEAQWNHPLQQAGADSVPLNEVRVELDNFGIREGCLVKVSTTFNNFPFAYI